MIVQHENHSKENENNMIYKDCYIKELENRLETIDSSRLKELNDELNLALHHNQEFNEQRQVDLAQIESLTKGNDKLKKLIDELRQVNNSFVASNKDYKAKNVKLENDFMSLRKVAEGLKDKIEQYGNSHSNRNQSTTVFNFNDEETQTGRFPSGTHLNHNVDEKSQNDNQKNSEKLLISEREKINRDESFENTDKFAEQYLGEFDGQDNQQQCFTGRSENVLKPSNTESISHTPNRSIKKCNNEQILSSKFEILRNESEAKQSVHDIKIFKTISNNNQLEDYYYELKDLYAVNKQELEKSEFTNEQLKLKIPILREELKSVTNQLLQSKNIVSEFQREVDELKRQTKEQELTNNDLVEEHKFNNQELDFYKDRLTQLENLLRSERKKSGVMDARLEELNLNFETDDISKKDQIKNLEKRVSHLVQENGELLKKMDEISHDKDKKIQHERTLQIEYRKKLGNLEEEKETLSMHNDNLRKQNELLRAKIFEKKSVNETQIEEIFKKKFMNISKKLVSQLNNVALVREEQQQEKEHIKKTLVKTKMFIFDLLKSASRHWKTDIRMLHHYKDQLYDSDTRKIRSSKERHNSYVGCSQYDCVKYPRRSNELPKLSDTKKDHSRPFHHQHPSYDNYDQFQRDSLSPSVAYSRNRTELSNSKSRRSNSNDLYYKKYNNPSYKSYDNINIEIPTIHKSNDKKSNLEISRIVYKKNYILENDRSGKKASRVNHRERSATDNSLSGKKFSQNLGRNKELTEIEELPLQKISNKKKKSGTQDRIYRDTQGNRDRARMYKEIENGLNKDNEPVRQIFSNEKHVNVFSEQVYSKLNDYSITVTDYSDENHKPKQNKINSQPTGYTHNDNYRNRQESKITRYDQYKPNTDHPPKQRENIYEDRSSMSRSRSRSRSLTKSFEEPKKPYYKYQQSEYSYENNNDNCNRRVFKNIEKMDVVEKNLDNNIQGGSSQKDTHAINNQGSSLQTFGEGNYIERIVTKKEHKLKGSLKKQDKMIVGSEGVDDSIEIAKRIRDLNKRLI